jgi:hypothetical protein
VSPEKALRTYFHAKDENRPHLLDAVFSTDARLEIRNRSDQISFPALTNGLAGIADVLVRRFNQTYENIHSFYLARPTSNEQAFSCDWLVVMTEKESKAVRVGCGRYEWAFKREPELSVTELIITIEVMLILDEALTGATMRWVGQLDYPWISRAALTCMPFIPELQPVREYLERERRAK